MLSHLKVEAVFYAKCTFAFYTYVRGLSHIFKSMRTSIRLEKNGIFCWNHRVFPHSLWIQPQQTRNCHNGSHLQITKLKWHTKKFVWRGLFWSRATVRSNIWSAKTWISCYSSLTAPIKALLKKATLECINSDPSRMKYDFIAPKPIKCSFMKWFSNLWRKGKSTGDCSLRMVLVARSQAFIPVHFRNLQTM